MRSTPRVPSGLPLLEIVYKYNYGKIQRLIATEGAGSTEQGDPYLSRFPEIYFNVYVHPVVQTKFLGR